MVNFISKRDSFVLFVKILLLLSFNIVLMVFMPYRFNVETIAWISILQLLGNLIVVNLKKKSTTIFVSLFILFSWFFHCGQIVKYAFKIKGNVPLPFYNYGNSQDFLNAFKFYFFSQFLLVCGLLFGLAKFSDYDGEKTSGISMDLKTAATVLVLIGIIPRLYIDITRIVTSLRGGYSNIYKLYIPTVLNSLAFFFDGGCLLFLYITFGEKGNTALFVGMIVYKFIVMISGARQYAVCYLIVWVVFYFWSLRKITLKNKIILFILAYFALVIIDFIGAVRADGFTLDGLSHIWDVKQNTLIGDTLGEFGSAFSSLVVAIRYVPSVTPHGIGNSYIAAILSVVPFLVSFFPILRNGVAYTTLLPNTVYFGGSYLGELFYNFSYYGIFGAFIVGYVVGKIQNTVDVDNNRIRTVWSCMLFFQLLLYIRGYITDMAQSCIWLWIVLFVLFNQPQRELNYYCSFEKDE